METSLQNKIVWITGASSGIGEALAYAFANKGAKLVLSSRREEELIRVKANCKPGIEIEVLVLDIDNAVELPEKVEWVINRFGKIDVLVNCAGQSQRSLAKETSPGVYRKIMEVNYFGTIQLSLSVLPHYLERNEGCFVAISSVAGVTGLPLRTAYCAAKHAVEGFFSSLRTETWRTNIKILVVRPGAVRTNIANNALVGDGNRFDKKDEVIEKGIPAEACAAAIVEAIEKNKKVLVVGSAKEKLLFVLNRFIPGVVFNIVKKLGS